MIGFTPSKESPLLKKRGAEGDLKIVFIAQILKSPSIPLLQRGKI